MKPITKIIDLHCDTLTECRKRHIGFSNSELHFSLDKLPQNIHICQAMAIFMPDNVRGADAEDYFYSVYDVYVRQMSMYKNKISEIRDFSNLNRALDTTGLSVMLTVEGGSVLAGKLENIPIIYDLGVRMMTLTWNAENEICGGSNTDLGFTPFGRIVVGEMERVGMVVDASHLSDRGFLELCTFAEKPFVASHSNSRTVCDHRRNLTDGMFTAIKERGGLVGLNYYDNFIKQGGGSENISDLLRHAHHFLALGGEDILSLGSDFDGADIPPYLDSVEKQLYFFEEMEKSGIPCRVIEKISYGNALRFFGDFLTGI